MCEEKETQDEKEVERQPSDELDEVQRTMDEGAKAEFLFW